MFEFSLAVINVCTFASSLMLHWYTLKKQLEISKVLKPVQTSQPACLPGLLENQLEKSCQTFDFSVSGRKVVGWPWPLRVRATAGPPPLHGSGAPHNK